MKKTKIIAVIIASLMLLTSFISVAFAFSSDDLNALGQYLGGNKNDNTNVDPDEPTSKGYSQVNSGSGLTEILRGIIGSAANGLSNSQLTEILKNFDITQLLGGDSDVINEIIEYIASFNNQGSTSKPATTEPTQPDISMPPQTEYYTTQVVPSYTYVYVPQTQAPPTYVYIPQTEPATVPIQTTAVEEATTVVEYVPPEMIITDVLTTGVYPAYSIEDETPESGNTLKIVAGLVIIVVSLVAVVGITIALKKSRI